MKKRTYYLCLAVILAGMVLALFLGMRVGNPIVPALIIVCAIGTIWFCHRQVSDVMTDDLESAIRGKAAMRALEVTVIIASIGFAAATWFYFAGSQGIGWYGYGNGSVLVTAVQHDLNGQTLYENSYFIANPENFSDDDTSALNLLFIKSTRVREFPFVFGMALGTVVVMLVGLYAAFSYYYTRKYEE